MAMNLDLKNLVERIERLEEEKAGLAQDIRDMYTEAHGKGYDKKALREIIKLRKQDERKRREHEAVVDTYRAALGMLDDTPLGNFALSKVA